MRWLNRLNFWQRIFLLAALACEIGLIVYFYHPTPRPSDMPGLYYAVVSFIDAVIPALYRATLWMLVVGCGLYVAFRAGRAVVDWVRAGREISD